MKIEVITDCTGTKQQAINNVFSKRFNTEAVEIILVKGEEGFPTPLSQDDFPLTIQKRFQWMKFAHNNPDVFIATIQRGYYYSYGLWFLSASVGIARPLFNILTAMTSSVPLPSECSKKKSLDLSKNMADILKEQYPEWDRKNVSVYELLTGEDELPWLEQPLRHCLKIPG